MVRFLSVEPLLEHVDLERYLYRKHTPCLGCTPDGALCSGHWSGARVDWVIAGGESGPEARPFDLAWARSLRDQCGEARVPYFLKQLGAKPIATGCSVGPGTSTDLSLVTDSHGGDEAEWPEDLRVRQLPGEVTT